MYILKTKEELNAERTLMGRYCLQVICGKSQADVQRHAQISWFFIGRGSKEFTVLWSGDKIYFDIDDKVSFELLEEDQWGLYEYFILITRLSNCTLPKGETFVPIMSDRAEHVLHTDRI